MGTCDIIENLTEKCDLISRLIQDAESCVDKNQVSHLYGMARDESDNISKSLRAHLSRKLPEHQLNVA